MEMDIKELGDIVIKTIDKGRYDTYFSEVEIQLHY